MDNRLLCIIVIGLLVNMWIGACTPSETTPTVDAAGTVAVQLASAMLTHTAAAYSPTSPPLPTPLPVTDTPVPTETSMPTVSDDQPILVTIIGEPDPPCTFGPGVSYDIQSYIHTPKQVVLLGIGSAPGWYVIRNPYFGAPCWLPADRVEIDPGINQSTLPVFTP